ncbi:hypothetical protein D9M69_718010 [compost metagenome]
MNHFREFLIVLQALAAVEVGNVAACHKGLLACSGDDDHANAFIALKLGERRFERQQGGSVQGIQRLGSVDS